MNFQRSITDTARARAAKRPWRAIVAALVAGSGFLGAALTALLMGCQPSVAGAGRPLIATATSYVEAVARDLLGDDLQVIRLAEPGICPGHFDIRPSLVRELRRCRALLRFDFQKSLDARVADHGTNGPIVVPITLRSGMCVPESYLTACRQAADHLATLGMLTRTNAEVRLQTITDRLEILSREATNRVARAHLSGVRVIASAHQRDFCEWLGLEVVADFRAADTASVGEIEAAIDAGERLQAQLVIANLPEGRRTADALAHRLKAQVVVFENFPTARGGRVSFDDMVEANVTALLHAAPQ